MHFGVDKFGDEAEARWYESGTPSSTFLHSRCSSLPFQPVSCAQWIGLTATAGGRHPVSPVQACQACVRCRLRHAPILKLQHVSTTTQPRRNVFVPREPARTSGGWAVARPITHSSQRTSTHQRHAVHRPRLDVHVKRTHVLDCAAYAVSWETGVSMTPPGPQTKCKAPFSTRVTSLVQFWCGMVIESGGGDTACWRGLLWKRSLTANGQGCGCWRHLVGVPTH